MSRADEIFIQNCKDILENGVWDTDREVRPRLEDGTPAQVVTVITISGVMTCPLTRLVRLGVILKTLLIKNWF